MVWGIVIAGGALLFVSLLWYIWVGKALQSQRAVNLAEKVPALEGERIDTEALNDLERRWADVKELQPLRSFAVDWAERAAKRIRKAKKQVKKPHQINRELRIYHSRSIYINRAFYVDVRIGPKGKHLPDLTDKEKNTLEQAKSERLQFEALEEVPLVRVELKFAEGDFSANKTQEQQKLKKDDLTQFRFLLKPLKAEHCILTVVISYVSTVPVPDQIVEKVTIDKTILLGDGPETKEHVEQATVTPASTATKVVEVKTLELPVSVKSLFGRNARELELLQKAFGPVVVVTLLGITLFTGQLESTDAIWYIIVGIVDAAGIPIIDALANPLARPNPDAPDGEEES